MREAYYWKEKIFLTLTYNESNVPNELKPIHLSNFIKRIRKNTDLKIKYFGVGEYGTKYHRPHYHILVFGIGTKNYEVLKNCWNMGFIKVGEFNEKTVTYCVSYILDKNKSIESSKWDGVVKQPPFLRVSKGLGLEWLEKNKEDIKRDISIKVKGKEVSLPRYYLRKLEDQIDKEILNERSIKRADERMKRLADKGVGTLDLTDHDIQYRKLKDRESKFFNEIRLMKHKL